MTPSRILFARLGTALLAAAAALSLAAPAMSQGNPPVFNNAPTFALPFPAICSTGTFNFSFALGNVMNHANGTLDLVMICGQNIVTVPGNGNGTFETASAVTSPIISSAQISQFSLANIDGDVNGNLDLVATDFQCNVDVFLGTGSGTFSGTPTQISEGLSPCGSAPGTFFVADFNGDGKPDIAVENRLSGAPSIIVLINGSTPGAVSFSAPLSLAVCIPASSPPQCIPANSPTQQFGGMAVGKFTGQSVPDLAVAIGTFVSGAGFTNSVYVLQNNGSGTGFTAVLPGVTLPATPTTGTLVGLVPANLSGDGHLDLAGVDSGDGAIFVLYGHGTGNLTTCSSSTPPITSCQSSAGQTITGLPPLFFASQLFAGNFNGPNGPPGLLFQSANECMSLLLGATGGGLQTTATTYVIGNSATSVVIGDVNNDGYTDAIASWNNGLRVFLNNTGGTLEGTQAFLTGTAPGEISLLQNFFGNGEQDLAVVPPTGITPATITVLGAPASGPNGTLPQLFGPERLGATSTANVTALTSGCILVNSNPCAIPFVAAATFDTGGGAPGSSSTGTSAADIIYIGSSGITAPTTIFSVPASPAVTAMAAGDFNGDGITDLAFAFGASNTIEVFTGNGDGTFSSTPLTISLGANQNPVALAVADFNGDGKADIAVLNQTANTVGILLNNTSNCSGGLPLCFAPMASYPIGFSFPAGFTVGDFNGDNKPDIAVVGGATIAILLNQGGGAFPKAAPTPVALPPSTFAAAIATGDFNGDGILDLAVALPFNPNSVEILNGIGDGTFAAATATLWSVGANPAAMVVANFKGNNGDGLPDIAVADFDPEGQTVALLLNGTAAATTPPPPATTPFAKYSPSNPSFDFGNVIVGQSPTYTITLTNTGAGPLAFSGISFGLTTSPGFSFTTTCTVPSTINPGDSCTATVQFAPTYPGASAVSLNFGDNAGPGESNLTSMAGNPFYQVVSFTGNGVSSGLLPPQISSVMPNLGLQGQQGLSVTITGMNFAAGLTTVTFGGGNAGITVVPGSLAVTSTSITAMLNIAQTTPATNYDVVVIVSGAPPSLPLIGGFTVAIPIPTVNEPITVNDQVTVTPLVINFAPPAAFFSASTLGFASGATQTLTVSNVGGAPLQFSGTPVITPVSGSFSITQYVCYDGSTTFPSMLPSGGACTLTITASGTPANDSGAIVFTDNAALSSPPSMPGSSYTQSIKLSGTGPTVVGQPPSGTVTVPTISETITVTDQLGKVTVLTASTTTLASSNPNAYAGNPITLTATVQSAISGSPTPTGKVTFFDGPVQLGSTSTSPGPANGMATATYVTSSLAVGIHPLTAVYSGDTNFSGSSSLPLVETISMPAYFTLSASPPSLNIQQGQSGQTYITVTPTGNFIISVPLTLSCPVLPNYAACVFSPSTVYLIGSTALPPIELTIYTTGLNGVSSVGGPPEGWLDLHNMRPGRIPPVLPAAVLLLIGMFALAARQKNEKNLRVRFALIVLLAGLGMLTACYHYGTPILPGTPFTPTGQSMAVIKVSGGGTTQTLNLPVTITPAQ